LNAIWGENCANGVSLVAILRGVIQRETAFHDAKFALASG